MARKLAVLVLPAVLATALMGCGETTNPANEKSKDPASQEAAAKDAGKAADDLPGLKELNAADRKLAEQQKVCPVSGSPLGTADMGKPYKMTVKGHVFFLCCDGCKEAVDKDPDGILKKVAALMAKK
jgi:YHS domain-containing protein